MINVRWGIHVSEKIEEIIIKHLNIKANCLSQPEQDSNQLHMER
jgi:hypothetical protein